MNQNKRFVEILLKNKPEINTCLSDYTIDLNKNNLRLMTKEQIEKYFCKTFSVYGYCPNNKVCSKSHDVEDILRLELIKKEKKNLKKIKTDLAVLNESVEYTNFNITFENCLNTIHNSGYDAFMTGAAFLCMLNKFNNFKLKDVCPKTKDNCDYFILDDFDELNQFNFKIYLTGKDYPLLVQKSNFSKTSVNHQEKKQRSLKD